MLSAKETLAKEPLVKEMALRVGAIMLNIKQMMRV